MWDSANQGEERGGKGELWFLLEFCDKGCLQVGLGTRGKLSPTSNREKQAFSYHRDGMSAQSEGEYAEALPTDDEAMQMENVAHQVPDALHCIHVQPQVSVMACWMHSRLSHASRSHASGGRVGLL